MAPKANTLSLWLPGFDLDAPVVDVPQAQVYPELFADAMPTPVSAP